MTGFDERWREIRAIWHAKENLWLYALVGFAAGALLVPFLLAETDALASLFPEAVGILFTVLVIDQLNERRAERQRKEELILQMGSPDNAFAVEAVRILRQKGWLMDGSLQGAQLWRANLQGAWLKHANLAQAVFLGANLERAMLTDANLQGAALELANLEGAVLWGTNLVGAWMEEANLKGAVLRDSKFDMTTLLPDGTFWTPGTDLTRFTDPKHPQFWRSDNPLSPVYQGGGSK